MILNVVVHEDVAHDLDHGKLFYEMQKEGLGNYFDDTLISDIESLLLYGGVHSKRFSLFRMFSSKFPYAIYYNVKKNTAIVLAVIDMRRDPHYTKTILSSRF